MATLNLGVHDISYAASFHQLKIGKKVKGKPGRTLSKAQAAYASGKTTGEIARYLEDKYKVMLTFWDMEKQKVIIPAIEHAVQGSIVNIMLGQPGLVLPTANAMFEIATKFKHNLSQQVYDGKIKGVPTAAAKRGVSHRFAKPYAVRPSRPSFIDSGTYQTNFVAWMED